MLVLPDPPDKRYTRPHYYTYLDNLDPLDILFEKYRQHGLCPPNKWARVIMKNADFLQWMNHGGRDLDPDRGVAILLGRRMYDAIKAGRRWEEDGKTYGLFRTYWWHTKPRPRKYAFVQVEVAEED